MKIISVDYGQKKIGIAKGDTSSQISFPQDCLKSKEELFSFLEKEKPKKILVGLPFVNENSDQTQEKICKNLAEELKNKGFDTELFDERFTTKISKQKFQEFGIKEKKSKHLEDSVSAQIILENYFQLNEVN